MASDPKWEFQIHWLDMAITVHSAKQILTFQRWAMTYLVGKKAGVYTLEKQ